MKITVNQLRRIIKEEVARMMEGEGEQASTIDQRWAKGSSEGMTKDEYSEFIIDVADELISMAESQAKTSEINKKVNYFLSSGRGSGDSGVDTEVDPLYGVEGFAMDYDAESISDEVLELIHNSIQHLLMNIDETKDPVQVRNLYARLATRFMKLKQLLVKLNDQVELVPGTLDVTAEEPMFESRRKVVRKR